jgi:hypothetical protein
MCALFPATNNLIWRSAIAMRYFWFYWPFQEKARKHIRFINSTLAMHQCISRMDILYFPCTTLNVRINHRRKYLSSSFFPSTRFLSKYIPRCGWCNINANIESNRKQSIRIGYATYQSYNQIIDRYLVRWNQLSSSSPSFVPLLSIISTTALTSHASSLPSNIPVAYNPYYSYHYYYYASPK